MFIARACFFTDIISRSVFTYLTLCFKMAFYDERAAAAIYLSFDEEDDARRKERRWWVGTIYENREKEGYPTTNLYVMCTDSVSDCIIVRVVYCVSTIVKKNKFNHQRS